MPNYPDRYEEQVAVILGSELGDYVTEEIIRMPIIQTAVFRLLDSKVPGIGDIPYGDPKKPFADAAIIYATAIELAGYVRFNVMKSEQSPAAKTERFEIDWNAMLDSLNAALDDALGEIDPEYAEQLSSGFVGFALSNPPDGRCCPCRGSPRQ